MAHKYRENPEICFLKNQLDYDENTGLFYWKEPKKNKVNAGDIAGSQHPSGYWHIRINRINYAAHRLAWFYYYGELSQFDQIDHYNLNRSDNRILNLRIANNAQNKRNSRVRKDSKSGIKCVRQDKRSRKYTSRIVVDGDQIWLGTFNTAEEAHEAYCEAASKYYGEFFRKE